MFRSGYRKTLYPVVICLVMLTCTQPVYAGEPTEQIRQSIDDVIAVVKAMKGSEKKAERRAKIRKIVDSIFDFREMSKRVLALNWKNRTAEEKKEFVPLFEDLIEDVYATKLEKYNGEKVEYGQESVDDGYARVQTTIVDRTGREIPVDYMLMKQSRKWAVYDVIIEGVSLIENYRSQFRDIIDSGSYNDLVIRLKRKELQQSK
jgi:phospholipid transport system substrate-binding protein